MFVKLANIVEGVVDGFEIDPAPLELPDRRLADLHASEAPKARRVEARFQREVKVEMRGKAAKRKIIGVLKRSMPVAGLPMKITTFVLKCWARYMAQTYLRNDIEPEAWRAAVRVMQQIIKATGVHEWRTEPQVIAPSTGVDFDQLQVTVEQARCYLDPQRVLLQRARSWFLRLCAEALAGTPACFAYESRTDFALEDESAGSQIQIRLNGLPARIPAEVTPVAWFEIYCGEDKAKRLKLSVVLEDIGRRLFAGRTSRGMLEVEP
jgi:hypothetical protein